MPRSAVAPLGLTTEGGTKFKLKDWKCYPNKLRCIPTLDPGDGSPRRSLALRKCPHMYSDRHLDKRTALNWGPQRTDAHLLPTPTFIQTSARTLLKPGDGLGHLLHHCGLDPPLPSLPPPLSASVNNVMKFEPRSSQGKIPLIINFYQVAIHSLPHLTCMRLFSVRSSHLPFKMH